MMNVNQRRVLRVREVRGGGMDVRERWEDEREEGRLMDWAERKDGASQSKSPGMR